MANKNKKLIIVDGNALIHRSFHALPPSLKAKDGRPTNAVYGFTSFLLKALLEFKPNYVIVAFDRKEKTFRHKEYALYKATRVKAADELYLQIPIVKEVIKSLNILSLEKAGFEADDIIGTVSRLAEKENNMETIIITGDLDTLQLISNKTKVYTMSRGLSDSVLYDIKKVEERYNLKPKQLIDFKALRGDPSDNIPGVKGIGEKGAINLLSHFNDLENTINAAKKNDEAIKPRIASLIIKHEKEAILSKKLAIIEKEVDINFSWHKAIFPQFENNNVYKLFSQLGFKSLLEKVKNLNSKNEDTNEKEVNIKIKNIKKTKDFNTFINNLKKEKKLSLAANYNEKNKILGLAFYSKSNLVYYLPLKKEKEQESLFAEKNNNEFLNETEKEKLKEFLSDKKIKKSAYNIKLIIKNFLQDNFLLSGINIDLLIANHLLYPDIRQKDNESLIFSELGYNLNQDDDKINRVCQLAFLNFKLAEKQKRELKQEKLWDLYKKFELELISILAKMEHYGIKLDVSYLNRLAKINKKEISELEIKIKNLAGKEFNLNSTKQLKEILYEDLKIPVIGIKKIKTGYSTAEEELEKIKNYHPIIPLLQEYRELFKLQSTYLEALPKLINLKTKRIHSNWQQSVTATGRLSSTEPNLQNIPIKSKRGKEIRGAFVAKANYKLLAFDYSQIELRLTAHLANDKTMIKAFLDDLDIHKKTAAAINNISEEEVNPRLRSEAKAVNFGIIYGQGPHGLSQAANISYYQAKEFINRYFEIYPGVKKMMEKSIKEARKNNYSQTIFGRKRPLADINSNIANTRKAAERMAINTPIQGSAADIIKLAMIEIDKLISKSEDDIKLLLQIHDELIFEVKNDLIEFWEKKIEDILINIVKLKVPILVKSSKANNWEDLK